MKNILLLTDFSDNSLHAINYGINLFGNVNYTLLHAYRSPHAGASMLVSINDVLLKEAKHGLDDFKKILTEENPGINLTLEAFYGDAEMGVSSLCETRKIDVVVMGTKGKSNIENIFIGSNVPGVVSSSKVPVIAVPNNCNLKLPKRVGLAIDFTENSDSSIFDPVISIAKKAKSEVMLFNVYDEDDMGDKPYSPQEDLQRSLLDGIFEEVDYSFHYIENEDIEKGIIDFVDRENIDMLTMISRKYGLFKRIFHRSMTKRLAMNPNIPLLVLHETEV